MVVLAVDLLAEWHNSLGSSQFNPHQPPLDSADGAVYDITYFIFELGQYDLTLRLTETL